MALVSVSAVVLGVTGVIRVIGAEDQVPVSLSTSVEETATQATSEATTPVVLPAPVTLGADPNARRVIRAGLTRKTSSSPPDIPDVALAAYQRAATVIDDADPDCQLDWTLVAAIGFVESNHGRYGGSRLDEEGVARPAIRGLRLDGKRNTKRIEDTDAGLLDRDERFDRAVGPMQFIPSTWSTVGVDADSDDVRDPQDIDDAALAAAVYLCHGSEDLSTVAGRRAAVHRYNASDSYVRLVLGIAKRYADGDALESFEGTVEVLSTATGEPSPILAALARERRPDAQIDPPKARLTTEPVSPTRSPSPSPSPTPSDPTPTPSNPTPTPSNPTPTPSAPTPSSTPPSHTPTSTTSQSQSASPTD